MAETLDFAAILQGVVARVKAAGPSRMLETARSEGAAALVHVDANIRAGLDEVSATVAEIPNRSGRRVARARLANSRRDIERMRRRFVASLAKLEKGVVEVLAKYEAEAGADEALTREIESILAEIGE